MTSPKTKFPIESFGPELMQALLEGGRRRVVLTFPGGDKVGFRRAHKFRMRIHMLRQRMRQESHQDYILATRARASLYWGTKAVEEGGPPEWKGDDQGKLGALLVIKPQDSEFADVLKASGVGVASVSPLFIENPTEVSIPDPEEGDYDDLINELERRKLDAPSK